MTSVVDFNLQCPIPISDYPKVLLAHGGGGRLMRDLIKEMFMAAFRCNSNAALHDSAEVATVAGRLAFTTDSYVVKPLFFPGGDIGSLAVYGTVNDLAVSGARPRFLSCSFVIEEGLPMETLWRVVQSMRIAAERCSVQIVTGDTKVVDRGKGDGLFINTAGIGNIADDVSINPVSVRPGDAVIVSGDLGRHGIAVMSAREGLSFETDVVSDCAPLHAAVEALISGGIEIHCLRDLTRGGLASALVEIAEDCSCGIAIEENKLAISAGVRSACEILGLDPLYVANEGCLVAFTPADQATQALRLLSGFSETCQAAVVGRVEESARGQVVLRTLLGTERVVDMLSGEQLPRIC